MRVRILEDHTLLAEALVAALGDEGFSAERIQSIDYPRTAALRTAVHGAVVLVDLDDRHRGFSRPARVAAVSTCGGRVIGLTSTGDLTVAALAVEAGAYGVLSKDCSFEELVTAICRVARDEALVPQAQHDLLQMHLRTGRSAAARAALAFEELTPRECEVLDAMLRGESAQMIADRLYVALATVRSQIRSILTKLGVNSQLAAVAMAREHGWQREHVAA